MKQTYQRNQSLEALFVKVNTEDTVEIYTINQDESEDVRYDSLNIVQLAAAYNLSDTMIGFFLNEHNLMISTKALR